MARKKKKRNNTNTQSNDTKKLESQKDELEKLQIDAEITDEDLEKVELNKEEIVQDKTTKNIEMVFKQALKLKKELETRKLDYSKKIKSLDDEKKLVENQKKENQKKKSELEEHLKEYNEKLKEINQLQVEEGFSSVIDRKILDEYFTKLKEQEALLVEKLSDVTEKHEKYIKLILKLDTEKMTLQKATLNEFTKNKNELMEEFKVKFLDKEKELLLKDIAIEKQIRDLDKRKKSLEYEIEDFEDEKEYLEEKSEKRVQEKITFLKDNIQILITKNDKLKQEKEELDEVLKYFGSRDPKKIVDDLKEKENEVYELQEKLALQPDKLKIDELNRLRQEKVDWESDLQELEAKLNEYKRRYENQKIQVGEK